MYTIKETAEIFGVHWQTIRNWIKCGKLRAVKVDRAVRIDPKEIQRVKAENQIGGHEE